MVDGVKIAVLGLLTLLLAMAANYGQDQVYTFHALLLTAIAGGRDDLDNPQRRVGKDHHRDVPKRVTWTRWSATASSRRRSGASWGS